MQLRQKWPLNVARSSPIGNKSFFNIHLTGKKNNHAGVTFECNMSGNKVQLHINGPMARTDTTLPTWKTNIYTFDRLTLIHFITQTNIHINFCLRKKTKCTWFLPKEQIYALRWQGKKCYEFAQSPWRRFIGRWTSDMHGYWFFLMRVAYNRWWPQLLSV